MTSGTKYDQGKLRYDLVPPQFIERIAEIMTYGATKYDDNNWMKFQPKDSHRLVAAAMRHLQEYRKDNPTDSESGFPHLAHCIVNLCMIQYILDRENDSGN